MKLLCSLCLGPISQQNQWGPKHSIWTPLALTVVKKKTFIVFCVLLKVIQIWMHLMMVNKFYFGVNYLFKYFFYAITPS